MLLAARISRGTFFLPVFVRVTHDGLRRTTHSVLEPTVDYKQTSSVIGNTDLKNQLHALLLEQSFYRKIAAFYMFLDSITTD